MFLAKGRNQGMLGRSLRIEVVVGVGDRKHTALSSSDHRRKTVYGNSAGSAEARTLYTVVKARVRPWEEAAEVARLPRNSAVAVEEEEADCTAAQEVLLWLVGLRRRRCRTDCAAARVARRSTPAAVWAGSRVAAAGNSAGQ